MNTKFIQDIGDIDFNNLEVGDQFILVDDGFKDFDIHEIYWVTYNKNNYLYNMKHLMLRYSLQGVQSISRATDLIFNINGKTLLLDTAEEDFELFSNHDISTLFYQIDMNYIKNNRTGKLAAGKHRIFYYKLPLNGVELMIMYDESLNERFINQNTYFAIISPDFKFKVFNVACANEFIQYLIENTQDQGLIQFKSDIIDNLNYSIEDYIKGKSNSQFLNLLEDESKIPDKYFKPVFQKDNIRFFLDYRNKKDSLLVAYNNTITNFIGDSYRRILQALNDYYYVDSRFYPFTLDNEFMNINGNYIFEHVDCEGIMLTDKFGNIIYKTIIDGIAVAATIQEQNDLIDRKKTIDILTNKC